MSSLFDAMNIAVTGLNAQGTAMSNISNNIANAQTIGFKADNTTFADLVNQNGLGQAGNGAGVMALSGYGVGVQGTLATAASATDLGIDGNGFFAVEAGQVAANSTTTFSGFTQYTRRGDFALNAQGYMANSVGNYLEGYAIDQTTGLANTGVLVPVQIAQQANAPVATSAVTLDANLPENATVGTTLSPTTLQVFDADGNEHNISVNFTPTAAGQWTADVQVPDAVGGFNNTLDLSFGAAGGVNAGTIQSITNAAGSAAFTVPTGAAAAAGQPATASFTVNFGQGPQTISLNLGTFNQATGLTQFASNNQQVNVTSLNQNGLPQGAFQSVSISTSGTVSANYSNGQSVALYQIPIAQVDNPDGMQAGSGGVFTPTSDSGNPILSTAGANGSGTVQSGELEDSTVDLTGQFTQMIQTQQVYDANSRAITTANDMLADLLSIIHS
jgi:flagellar hook protein FlgE